MSKDSINKPATQRDDNGQNDPNDVNGKIIGGAWLFSNHLAEKIEFQSHSPRKEATDSPKDRPNNVTDS